MDTVDVIGVSKTYRVQGHAPIPALREVSLSIHGGEILAILGLNGAGKTTLVKMLSGLVAPDSGRILVGGVESTARRSYLGRVGAVFEGNRNIYWRLTPFENIEYFGVLRGLSIRRARARANELLERFKLGDKRNAICAHLSRGMQQRLAIAISLVHEPGIIILDEPTIGVDVENVLEIVEHLKSLAASGITVVVTSHQLDVVRMLADRVALLVGGRLVATQPIDEFMRRSERAPYCLQLEEELDDARAGRLRELGVEHGGSQLHFPAEGLYDILDVLKPLRIGALNAATHDFSRIFMDRVKEYESA